jgi:hypothetical protein
VEQDAAGFELTGAQAAALNQHHPLSLHGLPPPDPVSRADIAIAIHLLPEERVRPAGLLVTRWLRRYLQRVNEELVDTLYACFTYCRLQEMEIPFQEMRSSLSEIFANHSWTCDEVDEILFEELPWPNEPVLIPFMPQLIRMREPAKLAMTIAFKDRFASLLPPVSADQE